MQTARAMMNGHLLQASLQKNLQAPLAQTCSKKKRGELLTLTAFDEYSRAFCFFGVQTHKFTCTMTTSEQQVKL